MRTADRKPASRRRARLALGIALPLGASLLVAGTSAASGAGTESINPFALIAGFSVLAQG